MDLKQYERAKFELAELLRSAAALDKKPSYEDEGRLRDLFARLAEDCFNLVVVGRFSRGKTSLMNAILGMDRLPVGIVPLTSVVTTVGYGTSEKAIIEFEGRRLPMEVPIDALPQYITQQHNPGNVRQVTMAEVKLPAEILRRGFYFVDTPGLGSPIAENTRTTEQFLPQADAFVVVTSYESLLSEDELRIVATASSSVRRVFVVVNKQDIVSHEERREALRYVNEQLRHVLGDNAPRVFSVSSRDGLQAKRSSDTARLAASGILELENELVRFLLEEKSAQFLLRLCDRVADLIRDLSRFAGAAPLSEQIRALSKRVGESHPSAALRSEAPESEAAAGSLQRFRPCEICAHISRSCFDFLCKYQYELSVSSDAQKSLAQRGGLCGLHTWQYGSLASPYGICTSYPALLENLAQWFRGAAASPPASASSAMEELLPTEASCALCEVRAKAEAEAIARIADQFRREAQTALCSRSALCLDHLRLLIASLDDPAVIRELLAREAGILERLSEDMRRYATKHDGVRRFLASEEETHAGERALMVVAGLRNAHRAAVSDS